MEPNLEQYLDFAESLRLNGCDYGLWKKFQQRTYRNTRIEKARDKINSICDNDESIGNAKWPLTEKAISKIGIVINELKINDS